jgi:glucose dehydrogenase
MSATLDYYLRAYDVRTGRKLWEDAAARRRPGHPMSYVSDKTASSTSSSWPAGTARSARAWAIRWWRMRCPTAARREAQSE